ncbi:hypothetical protein OM076_26665 [Solirubrobacter ginsenosidimutans]|uniref:Uncharacterized protein n=1 Tax=Solirubrobacter ginsenosidimutans TaxID=490573 RepID=A0A9X3MZ88_9ACTN|nr:hypothetical protein [Solirubrobacter ginsenosidimutans]MDA0163882.1 hypothetical protein [Solirubrobacter ginsenosidimutans]
MRGAVFIEAALVAAVLVPVAASARVRAGAVALGRPRQVVLGSMLVLALAAQFGLSSRAFPFVDWRMYSSLPHGDPVVLAYDVELRGGGRDALVPGRFLGPESADRFVERLRREVVGGDPSGSLRVLAGLYEAGTGRRVAAVVVSERRVSIGSGRAGAARERLRVVVP